MADANSGFAAHPYNDEQGADTRVQGLECELTAQFIREQT
jgi:hypothetical protein